MRSLKREKERPKEMNSTVVFNKPSSRKKLNVKKVDLKGWEYVCTFGNCLVYARGDKRRLIQEETGAVIFEYLIGIQEAKFENTSNTGRVNERKSNAKL